MAASSIPNPSGHPARFSGAVVDRLRDVLLSDYPEHRPFVFDPFAGTGERLAEILGDEFKGGGIELHRKFIVNSQLVTQGDATDIRCYPDRRFIVVTSPVYPNGMAERWNVSDTSKRNTYDAALTALGARRRPRNDMSSLGYRGTKRGGRSLKRIAYWTVADAAVGAWSHNGQCEAVYLNVSDFMSGGEVEPFVQDWRDLLRAHGWRPFTTFRVRTPRHKGNDNADQRVSHECIVVAQPDAKKPR